MRNDPHSSVEKVEAGNWGKMDLYEKLKEESQCRIDRLH
jgi:hypothetical protein